MDKSNRSFFLKVIILMGFIILACDMNDILSPLGRYSQSVKTQDSRQATKQAYDVTLSASESHLEKTPAEPKMISPVPQKTDSISSSIDESLPGLAGTWEYHYGEKDKLFYIMTIGWDGKHYQLTDCTGVGEVICEIQSQSWDGKTFSFTFYFPHTGYTTLNTITDISGDTLSGIRSGTGGDGTIVWRRSN